VIVGSLKTLGKDLLPPIVIRAIRGAPPRGIEFEGDYKTWAEAERNSEGYAAPQILDAVRTATQAVKDGRAAYERDGVSFAKPEFRLHLLACLQHAYLTRGLAQVFHVADIGGSLGTVYYQNKPLLSGIPQLLWSIVEQPHFVECGNREFADDCLKFYPQWPEVFDRRPVDLALYSSVLQYMPSPYEQLAAIGGAVRWLVLDRTPVTPSNQDRLTVQHVPDSIYRGSYPHWCLSESKLLACIRDLGFRNIAAFVSPIDRGALDFEYRGYFFEREGPA
jgi:putative methyltransferase (TIGR04325 family)